MLVLAVKVTQGIGGLVVFLRIREGFKDDGLESTHNVKCEMINVK
jgi:hypothetical protein